MPDIQFPDASPYNPNVKFGERPSAFDFVPNQYWSGIRAGSVTADLTGWIQDGLYSLGGVGGGIFYMPWGVYPVKDIDCPAGVEIVGDGKRRTFLKRIATLPPGRGVLNFAGDGSAVRKLAIDGMVTVPVGYTYAELVDPMEYKLTVDTSIWIHSGASNITVAQTLVYHTGGYAVLVDATTGDVTRVLLDDDDFENNRPNTAGMPGDTTAGGWGGGVHYQGDGFLYSVSGLHVDKSRFRRGAGNQLWGHLYGFSKLHSDIKATGCHFTDIGRDGIMLGGVSGGVVSDCHFRRIGYVCTDDTSPIGTPKWVSNQWAVALDTAGLVRGVNYTNNTFLNCLGACMDGDGYAEGTVSGNICRVSKPDEPEYAEDNVAGWTKDPEKPSASYCYGFQTSNSNAIDWSARGVNITGNYFYNLGLGAIRLYSARKCSAWGNTIWHPDESLAVPILLGNIGNGDNQRAQDNSIGENTVHWNPAGQNPVVFEHANTFPFASTDKNWIAGNRLFGTGMYEFRKDAGTASVTGRVYSSNADGLTIPSENYLQRESGYLRMYGGTDVLFTLLDRHAISEIGAGVTGGPLFNVSLNGAGGVISTGGRTVIPIDDCVATAVVASDSFLSMTQKFISGSFVYEDAKANLFDANFGLMRYNPTAKKFQISTAGGAAAGARIWTDLGGGGPAAPDQSVQWNDGGAFGGSADLVFNRTTKLLLATTAIATGARSALPISDVMATGVLYADQFLGLTYTAPFLDAKADLFDSNTGLMRYNAAVKKFQISTAGGAGTPRVWTDLTGGAGTPGAPLNSVQFNSASTFGGSANLLWDNIAQRLQLTGLAGTQAINVVEGWVESKGGFRTESPEATAVNVPYGGVTAVNHLAIRNDEGNGLTLIRTAATAQQWGFSINQYGHLWLKDDTWTRDRLHFYPASTTIVFNGGDITFSGAGNIAALGTATVDQVRVTKAGTDYAIEVMAGGIWVNRGVHIEQALYLKPYADPVTGLSNPPTAGYGGLAYKGGTVYRIWNGTAWVEANFGSMGGTPGGPDQAVQWNNNGSFGGDAEMLFNRTSKLLLVTRNIATGSRSSLPMVDLIATGVAYADNFYVFTDSTYDGTKANLFDGNYGLLRFDRVTKKFQISASVSGPPNARVWSDLYTGGAVVPGGVTGSVQYKTAAGIFGGDNFIKWDSVARLLTVTGDTNDAASIYSDYGWIQSMHGFYSPMPNSDNVINAPNGGVTARNLISIRDDQGPALKLARTVASGGQSADFQWRIDTTGAMVLKDSKNAIDRLTLSQNGLFSFTDGGAQSVTISGVSGFVTATTSMTAPLLRATVGNDTAIQATAGGIQVKSGAQVGQGLYLKAYPDPLAGLNPPPTTEFGAAATFGGLAYKGGTQYRVWNGSAWATVDFATVGGGVTSITGTANRITASSATGAVTLNLPQDIHTAANPAWNTVTAVAGYWTQDNAYGANSLQQIMTGGGVYFMAHSFNTTAGSNTFFSFRTALMGQGATDKVKIDEIGRVYIANYGDFGVPNTKLQVDGVIVTNQGLAAISTTAPDAIQAKSGGVWAMKITADMALYMKSTAASASLANPTGYGGLAHQSGTNYWLWNGSAWVTINLATVGGGVTSITGTVNQVIVNQGTGAVTLSLPQNIHTTGAPTFDTVTVAAQYLLLGTNGGGNANNYGQLLMSGNRLFICSGSNAGGAAADLSFRTAPPGGGQVDRLLIQSTGKINVNAQAGDDNTGSILQLRGFMSTDTGLAFQSYPTVPPAFTPIGGFAGLAHKYLDEWWIAPQFGPWKAVNFAGVKPADPDYSVQWQAAGSFAGSINFRWNPQIDALYLGNALHGDARMTVNGNVYLGSAGEYIGFGRLTAKNMMIQTCLNSNGFANGNLGADGLLRLQPITGRTIIGAGDWGGTICLYGCTVLVNDTPDSPSLSVISAAGQTQDMQRWTTNAGAPLVRIDSIGQVTAPVYFTTYMPATGPTTGFGQFVAHELRFAQLAPPAAVDQYHAGLISFRTLSPDSLAIVGAGTTDQNRLVRIFDDLYVQRNEYVVGSLGSGSLYSSKLEISNTVADSQVFIGSYGPRLSLGNATTHAGSSIRLNLVLSTDAGHYGIAQGSAWLFLENATAGINIGIHPRQTLRITAGNVLVTGDAAGTAALTVTTGYVDSGGGYLSRDRMTFLGVAAPGAPPAGQAYLFFDGASLYCRVPGGGNVNLSTPSGGGGGAVSSVSGGVGVSVSPTTGACVVSIGQYVGTSDTVTFANVTANGVVQANVSGSTLAFKTVNNNFNVNGNGYVSTAAGINSNTGFNVNNNPIIFLNGTTNVEISCNRVACYGNLADASIYTNGGITAALNMYAKQFVVRLANGTELPGVEEEDIEIPGGMLVRGVARTKFKVRGGIVVGTE